MKTLKKKKIVKSIEQESSLFKSSPKKEVIHFHKSYRKLKTLDNRYVAAVLLFLIGIPNLIIYLYFPEITLWISESAKALLSVYIPPEVISVHKSSYLVDGVYVLDLPGLFPTLRLSVLSAIVSLILLFIPFFMKRAIDPKFVWLIFISFINLISSLFFIFFPGHFPYNIKVFSELYIKTEVGIWLIIPYILALSFLTLPAQTWKKFLVIISTVAYAIVYAGIRYVCFIYLLREGSYLFMALMFLMFGPFLDFIYIVGVYSFYTAHIAKKTKKDMKLWNWSF